MILMSVGLKQGSTLSLGGLINLPVSNWTIESMVRDGDGVLIATLDSQLIDPVPPSDQYGLALYAAADVTMLWPAGTLYCDVKFEDDNFVIVSPTFTITVTKAQTHG